MDLYADSSGSNSANYKELISFMTSLGVFITIEGGEGVGKSTFIQSLTKTLTAKLSSNLVVTREPGGTPAADRIRSLFALDMAEDPFLKETEVFLVCAARSQHCGRLIIPALQKGNWVISDRFSDSTRVYQGILGGLSDDFLEPLLDKATFHRQPDLTLVLDCPVEIAMKRIQGRQQNGDAIKRYDRVTLEVHQKIRDGFKTLASKFSDRIEVLDASQAAEKVLQDALSLLKSKGLLV